MYLDEESIIYADSIIISINYHGEEKTTVLLVGRKGWGKDLEVVNVLQGKEAVELYRKLTTPKGEI